MIKQRYGDWLFSQQFASTIHINVSKNELCNVCANKNWLSTISFVLEKSVDSTQIMIQITVTIKTTVRIIILR